MRLLERPPDELGIDSLTGHNTLLVGAPYIGKSHLFRETAEDTTFTRVRRLDDALDTRPGEFVVLDEFYRAYQAASEDDRTTFESWLDREGGVCVITRPYDIDWLLNSAEVPLTDEILEAFDQVCLLRYAPDDDAERERAVQRCLSIGRDEAEAAVTREDVTAAIDDLFAIPSYEFTNAGLRDRIGIDSYDETLLPALVVYFSDRLDEDEGAILSDGVRDACAEILENVSVAQFFTETKDACRGLFSRDTLSDLGSDVLPGSPGPAVSAASILGGGAAAAPSALVAGGSLALYWHLRDEPDDTLDTEAVFGPLLGEELTPPARARLEADLEVPPRTIDNFRRVVRGDTAEQLVVNRDRLAAVDERLDTVEQAMTRYKTDLRRLDAVVDALDAAAIDHSDLVGFVTEAITEATGDIDDFREAVRAEERTNVLQVESIETLPQYYGDGDARLIELVGDDETELIVLRGAHGTGKTTAAYRACETLARSGYDVRLPNLETSSRDAIRYGLTATGDETVAVVAYHRGMADANTLRSARDLRQVLGWLDTDTCSTVILECREELYRSLDSLTGDIEDRHLKAIWRDATEISFDRMDEADLRQVITWTLDQLTFDGDREAIIREATRVSDGNPEIAKIAARVALADDTTLASIDSQDELIWSDIDRLLTRQTLVVDGQPIGGDVFEYTAAMRQLRTADLVAILGPTVSQRDLGVCAKYLSGYLGGDVRTAAAAREEGADPDQGRFLERSVADLEAVPLDADDVWQVSPDIYREVVFRLGCLRGRIPDRSLDDYLDTVGKLDDRQRYLGIAENLAQAYSHARDMGDEAFQQTVAEEAHELLKRVAADDVPPAVHVQCLEELIRSRLPVAAWHLSDNINRLVTGTTSGRDELVDANRLVSELEPRVDFDPAKMTAQNVSTNQIGNLYSNHCEFSGATHLGELKPVVRNLAAAYKVIEGANSAVFLENIYSIALASLAEAAANPNEVAACISEIDDQARDLATADVHTNDQAVFLENVYAMTFSKFAQNYSDPVNVDDWLEEVERRARATGEAINTRNQTKFLMGVFAMALAKFADLHPEPTRIDTWIDDVEARAITAVKQADNDVSEATMLSEFYGDALAMIAQYNRDPVTVAAWREAIDNRAGEAAVYTDFSPPRFRMLAYAKALTTFISNYASPTTVADWVEVFTDQAGHAAAAADLRETKSLIGFYAGVFVEAADSETDPDSIRPWLDDLKQRAVDAIGATQTPMSPDEIRAELNSKTVLNLAGLDTNPAALRDWVDAFLLPQEWDDSAFQAVAATLEQLLGEPREIAERWHPYLAGWSVATIPLTSLAEFCEVRAGLTTRRGDSEADTLVRFALAVLTAAQDPEGVLGADQPDHAARIAAVLALAIDRLWKATGLDGRDFDRLVAATDDLGETRPELHAALREAVPARLKDDHINFVAGLDWEQALDE